MYNKRKTVVYCNRFYVFIVTELHTMIWMCHSLRLKKKNGVFD